MVCEDVVGLSEEAEGVGDGLVEDVASLEEEVEGHGGGAGEAVGQQRQCVFCGVAVEDAQA